MEHIDEIHTNRIKHNICAVSIKKLTLSGNDVKTFASYYFNKYDKLLREIIESAPVVYDSGVFQRKTWALYGHFVSPEDFTEDNEIMLIKTSELEQLFKKEPSLRSMWYNYFLCFVTGTSKTITEEDVIEAHNEIKRICLIQVPDQIEYDIIMTPSIKDECLLGYIPRKGLYDIVKEHNPTYITNKSPQKCKIVDGELRIKLW